jgi:hypothetical protein
MEPIKFYPFSEQTKLFAPHPEPAFKYLPDWYKAQPATLDDERAIKHGDIPSTVKRCMPVFDIMTAGYMLKIPCDIFVDATDPEKVEWSLPVALKHLAKEMVTTHAPEQYDHYPIDTNRYHKRLFRIMPFWAIKTPPGYSTLFMNPIHQDHVPFWSFGGIIDTDKFASEGHFSILIEKDFKGILKQGTPLIQAIPFKRDDWSSEVMTLEDAQRDVFPQRMKVRSNFLHGYKNKFRAKKEYR